MRKTIASDAPHRSHTLAPPRAGRVFVLLLALAVAAAAPSAAAPKSKRCDVRLLRHGQLVLEAFLWDRYRHLGGQGESAEVSVSAQGEVRFRVGNPKIVEQPRNAGGQIETSVKLRYDGVETEWSTRPFQIDIAEPGGVVEIFTRVRPVQGEGLPSGRYLVQLDADCRP